MVNFPKIPKGNTDKGKNLLQRTLKVARGIASLLAATGIFATSVPAKASTATPSIKQPSVSIESFKAKPFIMQMPSPGSMNLHAQHESHYSHSSHYSHASHYSHYSSRG
jgi:hypothetical protein